MYYDMKRTPDGYRITKWDEFMKLDKAYNITYRRGHFYCDCPQGGKAPTCRHRDMVPIFCNHRAVDTGKFYCFDEDAWYQDVLLKGAA